MLFYFYYGWRREALLLSAAYKRFVRTKEEDLGHSGTSSHYQRPDGVAVRQFVAL
jgi:hypothetical protein